MSYDEDFALRSCHPLYAEFCREDEDENPEESDWDMDYEDDEERMRYEQDNAD